jgi:hypothetical protein
MFLETLTKCSIVEKNIIFICASIYKIWLLSDTLFEKLSIQRLKYIKLNYILLSLLLYSPLLGLGHFYSFSFPYTLRKNPWKENQPVARPLPTRRTTQIHSKHKHTSMLQTVLEFTTSSVWSSEDSSCLILRKIIFGFHHLTITTGRWRGNGGLTPHSS